MTIYFLGQGVLYIGNKKTHEETWFWWRLDLAEQKFLYVGKSGPVSTGMDDRQQASDARWYVTSNPGQLSLANPPWYIYLLAQRRKEVSTFPAPYTWWEHWSPNFDFKNLVFCQTPTPILGRIVWHKITDCVWPERNFKLFYNKRCIIVHKQSTGCKINCTKVRQTARKWDTKVQMRQIGPGVGVCFKWETLTPAKTRTLGDSNSDSDSTPLLDLIVSTKLHCVEAGYYWDG